MNETLTVTNFAQHVASGTPLLAITTDNEQRTSQLIENAARAIKGIEAPKTWSCTNGFPGVDDSLDPLKALRWSLAQPGHAIYIFVDIHWYWDDNPQLQRLLIDFAQQRSATRKSLVFLAPQLIVPQPLHNYVVQLNHPLPTAVELSAYLENGRSNDPFLDQLLNQEDALRKMVIAGQGLDLLRLERALRMAKITKGDNLDDVVASLHLDKKLALEQTGIIEFVENNLKADQVGGMENLKHWMTRREKAFGTTELSHG